MHNGTDDVIDPPDTSAEQLEEPTDDQCSTAVCQAYVLNDRIMMIPKSLI